MISFEDFKKLDVRIGRVVSAERIAGADKLLKLVFDMGEYERQVVAGIAETHTPEALIGKEMPVLVNLEPRELKGEMSRGMILAADADGEPVLLVPEKEIPPGSLVK